MASPVTQTVARLPRKVLVAFGGAALATAGFAAGLYWQVGGQEQLVYFSDAGTVLTPLIATISCYRAGRRQQTRLRAFWWLLAAACCSWMLGEVVWTGYDLFAGHGPPDLSVADAGYLAFIPLAVAALLAHPGMRGSGTRKTRSLFDGLSIAVALLFLSWTFVLGPIWRGSDLGNLGDFVTLAYPAGDVLIAFFVMLALRRVQTADRLGLWCLLAGLIALAIGDSTFAYIEQVRGYTTGNLLDTGWFAGFLSIALGAYVCQGRGREQGQNSRVLALPSLLAPLLPVFLALGAAGKGMSLESLQDRAGLAMLFILILLALLRQLLLVVDLIRMKRGSDHGTLFDALARTALQRDPGQRSNPVQSSGRP